MPAFSTLILDRSAVERLIDIPSAIAAVEEAFAAYACGRAQMPPKMYLDLKHLGGDFRAMPSYIQGSEACALKWVNVHPDNLLKGLPTVMAVIVLSDPATGFPLAVMDGTYLTAVRTAAAGAVAAKYLAREDSRILGLVGCGAQASFQLNFLRELFDFREVRVYGPDKTQRAAFARRMKKRGEVMISSEDIRSCVEGADMAVTITPSRKPLVKRGWISDGVHINAIGADAPGKEELDPRILQDAKIVIDDWAQASHSGEINVPLAKGLITRKNIYADIGSIVAGKKKGRVSSEEITVFDSTGLAIQDAAVAQAVYRAALKKKAGVRIRLF